MDLEADLIKSMAEAVNSQTRFQIDHHHLTLEGICQDCQAEAGTE
jgi:Fe2+ or Zn2+ uptake regulation protein